MADIAIITPIIGLPDVTLRYIRSIHSDEHNLKLFIIDNGTKLSDYNYLVRNINGISYQCLCMHKNMGVPYAYNEGLHAAINQGFDYFIICNNDIILAHRTIDKLFNEFFSSDFAMLSAYDVSPFATPKELNILNLPDEYHPEPDFALIMFGSEIVSSIGFFDEQFFPCYFDDDDYSARIWTAGYLSVAFKRAPFFHFGSVTNESVPNRICTHEMFRVNQQKFYQKWGAIPEKSRDKAIHKYYKYPYNNPGNHLYIPYPRY